jgi:hypothetical protein
MHLGLWTSKTIGDINVTEQNRGTFLESPFVLFVVVELSDLKLTV